MAFQVSKQMMIILTDYFTASEMHFPGIFISYYKTRGTVHKVRAWG